MTRINSLRHDFVNHIPDVLDDGVLYVSIPFTSATLTAVAADVGLRWLHR